MDRDRDLSDPAKSGANAPSARGFHPLVRLTVTFDPERQVAHLEFDQPAFRTWDFVLGVLEMARVEAERRKRFKETEILVAQQQQAQLQRSLAQAGPGLLLKPH